MVAGVQGVNRKYLEAPGRKAAIEPNRMILGPVGGCAVRLGAIAPRMGVGKGLETCLSVQQATGLPMLAALSAGGIKNLQVPPEVREIIITIDADDDGQSEAAAYELAYRLMREGRIARIGRSLDGVDFNDLLRD